MTAAYLILELFRRGIRLEVVEGAEIPDGRQPVEAQPGIERRLIDAFHPAQTGPAVSGQAHRRDAVPASDADRQGADGPLGVIVMVRVQVGGANSVVQAGLHLGDEFHLDGLPLFEGEVDPALPGPKLAGLITEAGAITDRVAERDAVRQVEMDCDPIGPPSPAGDFASLPEAGHIRHDRGPRGETPLQRLGDGEIHGRRHTEIVGGDDELGVHWLSTWDEATTPGDRR